MKVQIDVQKKELLTYMHLKLVRILKRKPRALFPTEPSRGKEWKVIHGRVKDFRHTDLVEMGQEGGYPWEKNPIWRVKQTRNNKEIYFVDL